MRQHFPIDPATGLENKALLPWFDGDPVAGIEGSFPGQALSTDAEAEILNLQAVAGLIASADGTDLAQIAQALARGVYVGTCTGTGDLPVATLGAVFPAFLAGMRVRGAVPAGNTVTNPVLQIKGIGTAAGTLNFPILKEDGSALAAGELKVNRRYTFEADGAGNVIVSGGGLTANAQAITTPITKTVHGTGADFPDLYAAFVWLSAYRITLAGSVTFQLAAVKFTYDTKKLLLNHPDWNRISVVGQAPIGGFPAPSAFSLRGYSSAQRTQDVTDDLALLRACLKSELTFVNGANFESRAGFGVLQNVLITGDTSPVDGLILRFAYQTVTNVAVVGFGGRGFVQGSGYCLASNLAAIGAGSHGIVADDGGQIGLFGPVLGLSNNGIGILATTTGCAVRFANSSGYLIARGNGMDGIVAQLNAAIETGSGSARTETNAADGARAYAGGKILAPLLGTSSNGGWGLRATDTGFVSGTGTTGTGNAAGAAQAVNAANICVTGTSISGTFSPAINNAGNTGSYIYS